MSQRAPNYGRKKLFYSWKNSNMQVDSMPKVMYNLSKIAHFLVYMTIIMISWRHHDR